MTTYTTAQIDAVVSQLEAAIGFPSAMVKTADGREIQYKTNVAIRDGLAYWKGLYPLASDAPASSKVKIRTVFVYSGNGYGY